MKKLVVTLSVMVPETTPVQVVEQLGEPHRLRMLLGDALHEFRCSRGPTAEAYVDKRYPQVDEHGKAMSWPFSREEKAEEVRNRREAAALLHQAVGQREFEIQMVEVKGDGGPDEGPIFGKDYEASRRAP